MLVLFKSFKGKNKKRCCFEICLYTCCGSLSASLTFTVCMFTVAYYSNVIYDV